MNDIDINLWRRALTLNAKAQTNGETLGRNKLQKLLNITRTQADHIAFALRNLNVLSCTNIQYPITDSSNIELTFGDVHIPFQDQVAVQVMLDYAKPLNPNIITIMGDMQDCYRISKFSKNILRGKRLFDELKEGRDFLCKLRDLFPDARIIYYVGNHELWIEKYICDKAPQLAELAETLLIDKLQLERLNIEYITKPFRIGKLWHLHGHQKGKTNFSAENILNIMQPYVQDHFIVFHFHRSQSKAFKRIDNRFWNTYSVGCLCDYSMDYAVLNKWQQGFGIVHYDQDGNFTFENKIIQNGIIY